MTTAQLNTTQSSTEVSVEIIDGKPTTTSIDVAAHFGKRHDAVLRAIRELECSPEFNAHNFVEVEYLDAKGERRPQFRMTRDGFTFLCMGFTGKEAAQWKEAYIRAFNKMEQVLIEQPEILSHKHLLRFALKTLELMREPEATRPKSPNAEHVVLNYLALESLDQATPQQLEKAITFVQGQMIGESLAAQSLPGVAGSCIAKDLLYGLLRSAHDAEQIFNSMYDKGIEKLASEVFKNHMANKLAETSQQARDLLGYLTSHAVRTPYAQKFTH